MKYKLVALISIIFALSACSQQTIVLDGSTKTMKKNDVLFSEEPFDPHMDANYKNHDHFYIWGIAQSRAINPAKTCGSIENVAKVETQTTFLDGLLSAITFGIYSPREVRIYCR
jgi:hypothetical protein